MAAPVRRAPGADSGRPRGLLVAVALWGFLLHLLVPAGWVVTLRLDAPRGSPADSHTPVVARG